MKKTAETPWCVTVSQMEKATGPAATAPARQPMLYRMKDLPATIRLSRTQIYKLIKAGEFPRPVSLGGTAVAWRHEDLEEWKANLRPL